MSHPILTLTDPTTGDTAHIAPELGCNCFSWQVHFGQQPRELLWSHPEFAGGQQRPSHSGIPLLFPFPGRLRGRSFTFNGQSYPLHCGDDGRGNAIHGFLLDRPWAVEAESPSSVTCRFVASQVDPTILEQWPSDFAVTSTYAIGPRRLDLTLTIENLGEGRLPYALGTHPYFRVPLAAETKADDCLVQVPVRRSWELSDMLPTGQIVWPSGGLLHEAVRFGDTVLDDAFTDVQFDPDGWATGRISDPAAGRSVQVAFDRSFGTVVVYTPAHREAICIEPYTAVPNSLELTAQGLDVGLKVLAPGERTTARMILSAA